MIINVTELYIGRANLSVGNGDSKGSPYLTITLDGNKYLRLYFYETSVDLETDAHVDIKGNDYGKVRIHVDTN
jgi:hypothetical protein